MLEEIIVGKERGVNIMYINLQKITQAKANITGVINETPLHYSDSFSHLAGNDIYLKLENLQVTGSFKIRGALNKILSLSAEEKSRGVVAFSAGNHGMGVAYASKRLGIQATVVLPENSILEKKKAILDLGANIVEESPESLALYERALRFQEEQGLALVHPYDDPLIIAGQGTIGIEIIDNLPEVDVVIVPVSGGGLISGIATALKEIKPTIKVIGVNIESVPAMYQSLKKGFPTKVDIKETIADGLTANKPGDLTFKHTQKYVDDLVLVSENEIAEAVYLLSKNTKLVVEPSGTVALAAILNQSTNLKNRKIAVLLTGGNINMELYTSIINKYHNVSD